MIERRGLREDVKKLREKEKTGRKEKKDRGVKTFS